VDAVSISPTRLVDAGYTSAAMLLDARARGITLLGPLLTGSGSKGQAPGYTNDWDRQQASCPQGATSSARRTASPRS
jgi:hypothetical protein